MDKIRIETRDLVAKNVGKNETLFRIASLIPQTRTAS